MTISVVIPTYNEEKNIGDCIQSLIKQSRKPDEIVVVDDGSSDKTIEIASNYGVVIVKSDHVGRGKIKNIGWKASSGEVVIFGDADTVFDKCWIEYIMHEMENNYVVAEKRAVYEPNTFYLKTLQAIYNINYHNYKPFCAWAMKREVLEKTGGFDKKLNVSEERDLGARIRKLGYIIGFAKDAVQYHRGEPRTFRSGLIRSFGHARGRINYYKKYPTEIPWNKIMMILILAISIIISATFIRLWYIPIVVAIVIYLYLFINQAVIKKGWSIVNKKYLLGIAGIRFFENIFEVAGIVVGYIKR